MTLPVTRTASRPDDRAGGERPHRADVVFNVVWTGTTFSSLRPFVESQIDQDRARYRFLANACPPEEEGAMEAFASSWGDRVTDVVIVARDRMLRHGEALDVALGSYDDGELFAFIDPDILARAPFLGPFLDVLERADAVTSGREVWSEGNVRPADHLGVSGEHFFDQDGFVFGSPHLAIYRRAPLLATVERWGVGFGVTGNDVSDGVRDRLSSLGRSYWVYDTGKIVNVLLQGDGRVLEHIEHPDLLHVGGVAHLLAPPSTAPAARGKRPAWGEGPDWGEQPGMAARHAVARHAAGTLDALRAGRPVPPPPADLPAPVLERLAEVCDALVGIMRAERSGGADGVSA